MRLLVMTEGKPFGAKDAASTNLINYLLGGKDES